LNGDSSDFSVSPFQLRRHTCLRGIRKFAHDLNHIVAECSAFHKRGCRGPSGPWTSLQALADEVAEARICAGFHYRFSTRVGTEMGRKIGQYIVQHAAQPAASTESR
jgi:hypothetical protein